MSGPSGLPARGTCYGYEVHSELSFRYLRGGGGDPLTVRAAPPPDTPPGPILREWSPRLFPNRARLHADGSGYRLWIDGGGWFGVDPESALLTVPPEGDPVLREERLWRIPIVLCFLARGDVPLHAACVEVEGRALLLAAPSRFGKSTLAMAFAEAGHRVLAEDLVCLRTGTLPAVVPGPAMLRVRRDVADAFALDGVRRLGGDEERLRLSLETERGDCEPVPLAGIALLKTADRAPSLERVEGAEVVRDLWALSFNLPNDEDRARSFRAVAELASNSTTWNLTRRLSREDLPATLDRLVEVVAAGS